MAHEPTDLVSTIQAYGPSLSHHQEGAGSDRSDPDKLVKTHCCFCGQQCGIQLKVKDDTVVGFEPWYDFPFNKGKLCPKGVKRYLQGAHPDRLETALQRDTGNITGFSPLGYEEAIARTAAEIKRVQDTYGKDAVGILGGASLTTEKAYLVGKFARVCLGTPYTDYNGRLCMVSAAAANKKAFGVDRAANPWEDMIGTDIVWISGANIGECAPITTDYVWQAREHGAKVVVVDPRMTSIARTADLFLPVRPGRDIALFNGVLREMIQHDWLDHEFIENHTVGFEELAASVDEWTLDKTAAVTGIQPKLIEKASEWWGTASKSFLLHARGIEHHTHGVENCLGAINIVMASGRIGRPQCGYATITGQANGQGGREHGQKCDQLPGARDISNPDHRAHVAEVWDVPVDSIPGPGVDCYEMMRKIHKGEIKALISLCFNPKVSLPDNNFVGEALDKLEFMTSIDFFMSETARHADIVLPGSLQEEDEGLITQIEGRIIKVNKAVECPGDAREDWKILQDIAAALERPRGFTFSGPGEILNELRRASSGGTADYGGVTYEKVEADGGIFWPCPTEGHPGTPRMFEPGSWNPIAKGAGPFYFPDGKARFVVAPYNDPAEVTDEEYPLILTSGRVVSHFLSGNQTRRIGPLNDQCPDPYIEIHPRTAAQLGVEHGQWTTVTTRRGDVTLRAMVVRTIRPDTIFVPYHWGGRRSINQCTISAQDPVSKIPEYKVCACRVQVADKPPHFEEKLQPEVNDISPAMSGGTSNRKFVGAQA